MSVSLALAGCADLMPAKDSSVPPGAVEKAAPAASQAAEEVPAASQAAEEVPAASQVPAEEESRPPVQRSRRVLPRTICTSCW